MRRLFIGVIAGMFPFCSAFADVGSDIKTDQPMVSTYLDATLYEAAAAGPGQTLNMILAEGRTSRSSRPVSPPPIIRLATASPS